MNLPDDFEVNDSGTFQVLQANTARVEELEKEVRTLKAEIANLRGEQNEAA